MTKDRESVRRKALWILFALMLSKLILQLFLNAHAGLHRDKYLYLALADHPDWGYISVPPFIGVLSWMIKNVFTDSAFWVRFPSVLAGLATLGLAGLIVLGLGGGWVAMLLAGLAFLFSPSNLRTSGLFMPVVFDILFWTAIAWVFFRWLGTRETRWWALLFPLMAFAFLNKYMIAFLGVGLVTAALITKDRRQVFSRPALAGMGIALGIVLPNIAWQINHHLPVVRHMAELNATQLANVDRLNFFKDQVLMNPTGVWIWMAGLIALLVSKRLKPYRPFGWTFLIVVGLLAFLRGKSYYTLGLYPPLFALGGITLENLEGLKGKVVRIMAIVFTIGLAVPIIPFTMPVLSPQKTEAYCRLMGSIGLTWEDGKNHAIPQDFADMIGWDEVGRKIRDVWIGLDENTKKQTAIFADNYGQAGSARYFGRRDGVPEAVSFCDNFVLWSPDSLRYRTLIAVHQDTVWLRGYFKNAVQLAVLDNPYFRECGSSVWLFSEPDSSLYRDYPRWVRRHRGE
jgi:hypothetical protein